MQDQKRNVKTIQPQQLFELLNVKNTEETQKVLATALAFLAYMSPGDEMQTSDLVFEKIAPDLIHIRTEVDLTTVVDSMEKKRILRMPV